MPDADEELGSAGREMSRALRMAAGGVMMAARMRAQQREEGLKREIADQRTGAPLPPPQQVQRPGPSTTMVHDVEQQRAQQQRLQHQQDVPKTR